MNSPGSCTLRSALRDTTFTTSTALREQSARHGQKNQDFKHAHSICSPDRPDLTKADPVGGKTVWWPGFGFRGLVNRIPPLESTTSWVRFCKKENAPVLSGVAGRCINNTSWVRFCKKTFCFVVAPPVRQGS